MGYTHYWENTADAIPYEALVIIREIIEDAYKAGLIQYEEDDAKPPVVTEKLIRFNGVGANAHETFSFNVQDDYRTSDGKPFAFCKTAEKPYDAVVMKVLIVLKRYLRDGLRVTSDGSFAEEWEDARAEMEERYGIHTYVDARLEVL
ncbi:MAG: hypothetical protein ACR2IV_17535 [Bryobacteraceae bacterium]